MLVNKSISSQIIVKEFQADLDDVVDPNKSQDNLQHQQLITYSNSLKRLGEHKPMVAQK